MDNNDLSEWTTALSAWNNFAARHPELGYGRTKWHLHNFLRLHRAGLLAGDAIRKAKGRHWIAHQQRFPVIAFDCATGAVRTARGDVS